METPKNKLRGSVRNPTPRLSERKKSLFSSKEEAQAQDDLMDGIKPLDPGDNRPGLRSTRSRRSIATLMPCDDRHLLKITTDGYQPDTPSRRSMRLSTSNSVSTIRKSPRQSTPAVICSPRKQKNDKLLKEKERESVEAEDQLQKLFNSSMMLNSKKETNHSISILTKSNSVGNSCENIKETNKRQNEASANTSGRGSPQKKVQRLESDPSFPSKLVSISTKSFYSNTKSSPPTKTSTASFKPINISPPFRKHNRLMVNQINKGVSHKIRRRPKQLGLYNHNSIDVDLILNNVRNEKLRNLITNQRQEKTQIENVHKILKNSQNPIELARPLSCISNSANFESNNIKNCFNNNNKSKTGLKQNSFDAFNEEHNFTFSDIESESDDENPLDQNLKLEKLVPAIEPIMSTTNTTNKTKNRKFFKSDRSSSSRKEVKITENIKASVCNGKIALVEQKKPARKKIKLSNPPVNAFSAEQATVDAILKNLDDTAFGDLTSTSADLDLICEVKSNNNSPIEENSTIELDLYDDENSTNELELYDNADYSEFRNRLPYKTSDPELIEQQHLLLDFLINNNICTEENFTIFIADPDNHKEEASRIVDQVIVVVNEQSVFRERIPYGTNDPEIIQQQYEKLDFLIKHNICTEENFDIFIANYENRFDEAENIVKNVLMQDSYENVETLPLQSVKPNIQMPAVVDVFDNDMEVEIGNQNKVNAEILGSKQKEFVQEQPTIISDKLFPIFYKGNCQPLKQKSTRKIGRYWNGGHGANQYQIDAGQKNFGAQQCKYCGLVYTVHEPEEEKLHQEYHSSMYVLRFKGWIDEDIVAIYSEWGPDGRIVRISDGSHIKRRERLLDVLKIVDKELGFSQYILPKTFVAYFAVRKYQIVGLCLVQPLQKANKYMCVDGVDCCSIEEYDAKCGISRIWVSPLHRRMHIGAKLLQAVQCNTIFAEEIPLDKIAFSAPTENGRKFAQKVTKMENFLVYQ